MNKLHLAKGSQIPELSEDGKLRLYTMRFCPWAQRVVLVMDAKKIPYHIININLKSKPEWLIQKSPSGKVPALEIPTEGVSLVESLVICDYLDNQYPENPLRSSDPLQRARDKILIEQFISGLMPINMKLVFKNDSDDTTKTVEESDKFFDIYEAELKTRGTKFFSGSKPGFVDYMIWPWIERTEVIPIILGTQDEKPDTGRFGKLTEWKSAMKRDPAVAVSIISAGDHLKFIRSMKTDKPLYDLLA